MDLNFVTTLERDTSVAMSGRWGLELYVEVAVTKLITGCDIGLIRRNEL
jgi:hypothetical protein